MRATAAPAFVRFVVYLVVAATSTARADLIRFANLPNHRAGKGGSDIVKTTTILAKPLVSVRRICRGVEVQPAPAAVLAALRTVYRVAVTPKLQPVPHDLAPDFQTC
jgi:hypothetical protein